MKSLFFTFAFVVIAIPSLAQTPQPKSEPQIQTKAPQPPAGWWKTGSHPGDFDFYPDPAVKRGGRAGATLKARPTAEKGHHAAMAQTVKPDNYCGKRIRLSGYLKTENVSGYSGFWLRIDDTIDNVMFLAFDNMSNRPVKGTTDWTKYEVVLDVSDKAELIAFGVNLVGSGQVWADDLRLETVGSEIATTDVPLTPERSESFKKWAEEFDRKNPEKAARNRESLVKARKESPMHPENLDFEK